MIVRDMMTTTSTSEEVTVVVEASTRRVLVLSSLKCEDCCNERPSFGWPYDRWCRWCKPCSEAHASYHNTLALHTVVADVLIAGVLVVGAVEVKNKKCEDCGMKQPSCGLPDDRRRRWCKPCSEARAGCCVENAMIVYRRPLRGMTIYPSGQNARGMSAE